MISSSNCTSYSYFRGPRAALDLRAQNLSTFLQLAGGVDDDAWLNHLRAGEYSKVVPRRH
jgi:hypothetical protein